MQDGERRPPGGLRARAEAVTRRADDGIPRTSGRGRRFELVLMRVRPPMPRTVGVIAKHAGRDRYLWLLMMDRPHAAPESLAALLAVAYLDEANGLLGRGDPRWAVPRAYLRASGKVDMEDRPHWDSEALPGTARRELDRISAWLRSRHAPYLEELAGALRDGHGHEGERFRTLSPAEAERRGFVDPTGRALVAPAPPPVAVSVKPRDRQQEPGRFAFRLSWRRLPFRRA